MKYWFICILIFWGMYVQAQYEVHQEIQEIITQLKQSNFKITSQIEEKLKRIGTPAKNALREEATKSSGIVRSRCLKLLVKIFPFESSPVTTAFFFKLDEKAQVFYLKQLAKFQHTAFHQFQWELLEQFNILPKPVLFIIRHLYSHQNKTEQSRNIFRLQSLLKSSSNPAVRIGAALYLTLEGSPYGLDHLIQATACNCHQFHFKLRAFLLEILAGHYIEDPFSSISWEQQLQKWWVGAKQTFPLSRQKEKMQQVFLDVFFGNQSLIEVPLFPFCECNRCIQDSPVLPKEDILYTYASLNNYKGIVAFEISAKKRTVSVEIRLEFVSYPSVPKNISENWKKLIEQIWSDRYYLQGSKHHWDHYCLNKRYDTYQVKLKVFFTNKRPHQKIQVGEYSKLSGHQGLWNLKWATGKDARFRNAPAHEIGHLLGNYDEYPGGALNPQGSFKDIPDSIMGTKMSKVYPRHYSVFRVWLAKRLRKPFSVVKKIKKKPLNYKR